MHGLTMPKWGLSMTEGRIVSWLVDEGAPVGPGTAVVEVETDKALSTVESSVSGKLRRQVARANDVVPVGGLLAVIAGGEVADPEVDRFIAEHPTRCTTAATTPGLDATPETTVVRGQALRYLKRGEGGEPALLIHGFGGDLNTWLFNHQALAAHRAVYALDLPGHGGSSKQVGTGTLREFADVVAAFLDALGVTRAHLVGHSMGGAVALQFAVAHPERCLSLVLLASAGLGSEIDGEFIDGFIAGKRRKEIKPHLDKLFADPRVVSRQFVEDVLQYKRLDGVESALRTIAAQLFPGGRQATVHREQLSQFGFPVLVIWGTEDRILPVSHARGLPGSVRAEILPSVGHMVHMEAAARVNQLIDSFWG